MNFLDSTLPRLLLCSATDLREQPELRFPTSLDWRKVNDFLDGTWPTPWPTPFFLGEDPKKDKWWERGLKKSKYVVFDVETEQLPDGTFTGRIIQVGMYPSGGTPVIWDRILCPDFDFSRMFRDIIQHHKVVAHNAFFDIARIWDNFDISVWEYADVEDTILMHHILYSEFPHNLEFLLSLYSNHGKAKHLGVGNYDYLVGDIVGTAEAYDALIEEFNVDAASAELYTRTLKPLIHILADFMHTGVPVNAEFVEQCLTWIPQQMEYARCVAEAYAGFPVSLESGPQMRVLLTVLEDVFATAKKLSGATVKRVITDKGMLSLDKETVSGLRTAFVPLEHNEDLTPELLASRVDEGAHPLLEAKALWIRARVLLSNYITPLLIPLTGDEESGFQYEGLLHVGDGAPQRLFEELDNANV